VSSYQILCRSVKPLPRYRDFPAFKMVAVCHLGFLEVRIFETSRVQKVTLRHLAKFHSDRSNLCFSIFFSKWRPSPSRISCVRVWTTYREHLLMFIIVQNLVGTDAIVSTIWKF